MRRNIPAVSFPGWLFKSMKKLFAALFVGLGLAVVFDVSAADSSQQPFPDYHSELNIVYSRIGNQELKLNAFLPTGITGPVPAIVEIHGGWWIGGDAAATVK